MDEISLQVPTPILDSLPEDGDNARMDMQRAVEGWEIQLNRAVEAAADDDEAVGAIVDALERFGNRWEQYDDFVVELRAWGQSPIYAMAWRDLQSSLIQQVYDHEGLADRLDRERHARILDDGIRPK